MAQWFILKTNFGGTYKSQKLDRTIDSAEKLFKTLKGVQWITITDSLTNNVVYKIER